MTPRPGRLGFTLVELLVTLTLVSLMAGVVTLAWRRAPNVLTVDPIRARILAARDSALRIGHPVTIWVADSADGVDGMEATALPDGRVLASDTLAINPWSGTPDRVDRTP